jgi:hypothetical protein
VTEGTTHRGDHDAATLLGRLLDAFEEATSTPGGFEAVRDAMASGKSFEEVAGQVGGEMGRAQLALIHPEIVCDYSALAASTMDGPNIFSGHEEWIKMWNLWFEPWEWWEWAERTIEPIDEERALFTAIGRCRGRASGVTVEIPQNGIWTARDGQLVAFRAYDTREEALASLERETAR